MKHIPKSSFVNRKALVRMLLFTLAINSKPELDDRNWICFLTGVKFHEYNKRLLNVHYEILQSKVISPRR